MPNFTTNTIRQLSGASDGCVMGQSATDLISFYGTTAVAQPATIAAVGTTASQVTTPIGFTTTTQADAIVTSLNSVIAALKTLGLIASA